MWQETNYENKSYTTIMTRQGVDTKEWKRHLIESHRAITGQDYDELSKNTSTHATYAGKVERRGIYLTASYIQCQHPTNRGRLLHGTLLLSYPNQENR